MLIPIPFEARDELSTLADQLGQEAYLDWIWLERLRERQERLPSDQCIQASTGNWPIPDRSRPSVRLVGIGIGGILARRKAWKGVE